MRILCALVAFAMLAGCADDAPTDDAEVPVVEVGAGFEPTIHEFSGSAMRAANFCNSEGGEFPEDVAGWHHAFEADRDGMYVVWQNSAGENHGTAEGEGTVPSGAVSFFVCNDLLDQAMSGGYTLTLTEPAPDEDADHDGHDMG